MEIRLATSADALAVARVHVRAWQQGYRGLIAQDYLDGLRPEDRAGRYTFDRMTPDGPFTLVAVDGDAICGLATTGRSREADLPEAGEIWAMYVDPPRWGTGVGQLMMAAARAQLRADGHRTATLWVITANRRARRFYEADGWRPDGVERTDVVGGTTIHEVRYQRTLG